MAGVVPADAVQAEENAAVPQASGLALHAREASIVMIDEQVVSRRG